MSRLWLRNLSRDDRVISANAVEVRFPFLKREMAEYCLREGMAEFLVDFSQEIGKGDKVS